jgi:hypothetical protein
MQSVRIGWGFTQTSADSHERDLFQSLVRKLRFVEIDCFEQWNLDSQWPTRWFWTSISRLSQLSPRLAMWRMCIKTHILSHIIIHIATTLSAFTALASLAVSVGESSRKNTSAASRRLLCEIQRVGEGTSQDRLGDRKGLEYIQANEIRGKPR